MSANDSPTGPEPEPATTPRLAWHHAPASEAATHWKTSLTDGLDDKEAATRLGRLGPNKLPEAPPEPLWKKILAQISDFTVLALLGAAAIAAGLGLFMPNPGDGTLERFGDSIAIVGIVILNLILGLVQERRAERALDSLRDMTAPTANVIRGGRPNQLSSHDLVPGDVILLEEGDRVPADARLFEEFDLECEEAALTGESVAVAKSASAILDIATPLAERRNMIFMGTRVSKGRGRAVVVSTALGTELGHIAGMLARVEPEETPLEQDLERFGKQVVIGCIAISAVVFLAGLLLAHAPMRELFLVAVALAVAAIPEGLPAVTTIVLAIGTQRMATRHALVRRLPAVETLGCAQIICTDKTGTLTQNAMSVRRVFAGGSEYEVEGEARKSTGAIKLITGQGDKVALHRLYDVAHHAAGAALSTSGELIEVQGDATDGAMKILALRMQYKSVLSVLCENPFTSQRRMASLLVSDGVAPRALVRGAPEALLDRAKRVYWNGELVPLTPELKQELLDVAARWGQRSMRVIGLGERTDVEAPQGEVQPNHEWETSIDFIGLCGIVDPPRPEVKAAIAEARSAGVRTVMITGDHPVTARAIAEEIGLWVDQATMLTGPEIDHLDEQGLVNKIDRLAVVARATAEHKLRIVNAMKSRGWICAMTGDGVNDAPAVKAASIGIAMGKAGSDVTKESAALVLADDNYATIVAAVEEGRAIYANIRKFIFFLLSSNAGAVLFVLVAAMLGWETPLAPIQILWINLITNGLPALALGVDARDPEQMTQPPRDPGSPILTAKEYVYICVVGAVMATTALVAFSHFLPDPRHAHSPEALARARAIVFAILSVGPLMHSLNCRSEHRSMFKVGVFGNRWLWGSIGIGLLLQTITIYVAPLRPIFKTAFLDGEALAWVGVMSLVPIVFVELLKAVLGEKLRFMKTAKPLV